jgi:parallel beta-helix repeat protein/predicted outer membrane repeat protein
MKKRNNKLYDRLYFLLIVFNFCLNSINSSASSIEVSGMVSGTWDVDTVNVIGNIEIPENDGLYIDEGVTVLFHGAYFLKVSGNFEAQGSFNNPVLFTISDTTGFYNDTIAMGGWKQIRIENLNSQDSIFINHCKFEYGKAVDEDSIHGYGGAICIRDFDHVAISNCSFINNYAYYKGGAVYLLNASVRIADNSFENNRCGQQDIDYGYGGGICADSSSSIVVRNYFSENSSTGIGGGMCTRFTDGLIQHNIFENNYSALGGGFGMLHIESCESLISNNLVINNRALFFGAGISNGDCSPIYVNNTIVNNHCDGGGGGFYCKDSVTPVLINNIIYGNTQYGGDTNQVYLWDNLSQPNFFNNDIQGGVEEFDGTGGADFKGKYVDNIDQDPYFEPSTQVPSLSSPCVNSGSLENYGLEFPVLDLAENTRIVDDTIDMGAYEQQTMVKVFDAKSIDIAKFNVYPNPADNHVQIEFDVVNNDIVKIYLMNIQGVMLDKVCEKELANGHHAIMYNLCKYPKGSYYISIKTRYSSTSKYIVIE